MSRRQIIWLTIWALIIADYYFGKLDFFSFVFLFFVGLTLANIFDPRKTSPTGEAPKTETEDDACEDVIRIRRRHVEMLRNSLMRHHNSRCTDRDYQISASSQETTEILQVLNAALAKKQRQIQA